MSIIEHLDKENLHHAYLIKGARDEIVPKIIEFCESVKIKTLGNPDFAHIVIDNFKIDEAFDLRKMSSNKSFSSSKKIFILCVNSISADAQNVLLKMFEEPIENTHFFMIMPDTNVLLKTLLSRFYFIKPETGSNDAIREAEKFLTLSLPNRINFIKELLVEPEEEDEEGNEIAILDSARSKALKFINALESILSKTVFDPRMFEHFFKVREFLRMPGSSVKNLMESIALIIPEEKV